jgi:hypothetical protein
LSRSRAILIAAAVAGLGLAWILQPLFPPYKAHVRMVLSAPPATGDWDQRVQDWYLSFIHARRTARTGPIGARIHHPRNQSDDFDITVSSRERGFALKVVSDIVNEAVQTPGLKVQVLDPPASIRFTDPSPAALLSGAGIGLLIGLLVVKRMETLADD